MISSRQQYYELMLTDPDLEQHTRHNRIMEQAYARQRRATGGTLTDEQMMAKQKEYDAMEAKDKRRGL